MKDEAPLPDAPVENDKINQTDMVVVEVLSLMLGGAVIKTPQSQAGLDEALEHMKRHFAQHNLNKAAALIEHIRLKSVSYRSDPALLNKLRERPPGSGQPN